MHGQDTVLAFHGLNNIHVQEYESPLLDLFYFLGIPSRGTPKFIRADNITHGTLGGLDREIPYDFFPRLAVFKAVLDNVRLDRVTQVMMGSDIGILHVQEHVIVGTLWIVTRLAGSAILLEIPGLDNKV